MVVMQRLRYHNAASFAQPNTQLRDAAHALILKQFTAYMGVPLWSRRGVT